jgi:hypothetical protein
MRRYRTRRCFLFLALSLAAAVVARAQTTIGSLSVTFTNPAPASSDFFGYAVAALGTDRVIVGAYSDDTGASDAGAVYLFSTNGTRLTTFTNPAPAVGDAFGIAVAALGTDRILIGAFADDTGATNAGIAYIFTTNGTRLITFTNPAPAFSDRFGAAVAAVGADKVLIGAYSDDTGATNAGAAYLFGTNGTLLTTFTNPAPTRDDLFGLAVASVGSGRVVIGAYQDDTGATDTGAAYLFSTNGTLLTTFANPTPEISESFGYAVAGVGNDRVLIGAYGDKAHGTDSGAAYLFSTNGTLLITFTNPAPAISASFGYAVAAVGTNQVLIGSTGGASGVGAAYLFSTNGVLLTTISNPSPASSDQFGFAVAAVGTAKVIIGAWRDDTGASDAGAAYLFSLTTLDLPLLSVERVAGGGVRLFWPRPATSFVLDQTTALASPPATNSWSQVPFPYQTNATQISVTVTPAGSRFYRLRRP